MMKLVRGSNTVVGFTDDDLARLVVNEVVVVNGADIDVPGRTFYFLVGHSDEQMLADLLRGGYKIDQMGSRAESDGRVKVAALVGGAITIFVIACVMIAFALVS